MYTRITIYQYSLRALSATTKMWLQLFDENNDSVSHVLFLDQANIPTPRLNPTDNKVWIYFHKKTIFRRLSTCFAMKIRYISTLPRTVMLPCKRRQSRSVKKKPKS